jgi:hypothetical protein
VAYALPKMKQKQTVLYCFSPPVMLATFLLEIGLLVYALWRYKMTPITRVIALLLAFLATFQLAEYYVCTGDGTSGLLWTRVGFVAITLLPPLGLHLLYLLAERSDRGLVYGAYAIGAFWALVFGASGWAFTGQICSGNYAIFQLRDGVTIPYALYYYGLLMTVLGLAPRFARRAKKPHATAVYLLVTSYLLFLVPTALANTLRPDTIRAIPSVMCGFAVLYALILTLGILPKVVAKSEKEK